MPNLPGIEKSVSPPESRRLTNPLPHVKLRRFCSARLRPGSTSAPVLLALLTPLAAAWLVTWLAFGLGKLNCDENRNLKK
jgi:hypothetical protein